jgi:hypothetical protein
MIADGIDQTYNELIYLAQEVSEVEIAKHQTLAPEDFTKMFIRCSS